MWIPLSTNPQVLLLQQCSEPNLDSKSSQGFTKSSQGYSSMARGFNGRPCSFSNSSNEPAAHTQQTSSTQASVPVSLSSDLNVRSSTQSPGHSNNSKLVAASQLAGSQVRGWSSGQSQADADVAALLQSISGPPAKAGIYDGPWQVRVKESGFLF